MNGEGALTQQQGIAAQIPYKNILLPNPATQFLNAFALGVEVNRKRQAMEHQLQQLVLQNERLQFQDQWKNQQFDLQREHYQNMYDIGMKGREIQQDKLDKAYGLADRTTEAVKALSDIEDRAGTEAYKQKANLVRSAYADVFGTKQGETLWNQTMKTHEDAAKQYRQSRQDIITDFARNVKSLTNSNYFDPNEWGQTDEDKKNGVYYRALGTTGTGGVTVLPPNTPNDKVTKYQHLPSKTFDTLKSQVETLPGLVGATGNLGDMPASPSSTAYEVTRNVNGRKAIFNSQTKEFLRWGDE